MMRCGLLGFGLQLLTAHAWAAGFMADEQGARATGRANAVAATVTDGAALVHNPAGLAFAKGWTFCAGATLLAANNQFEELDGTLHVADTEVSLWPNFYANGPITDMIAAGVGLSTPFSHQISWPEGTPGGDIIRSQTLRTFFISAGLAFDLSRWLPQLSVGLTADFVPASLAFERDIIYGDDVGDAMVGAEAFGAGGRVGAMWRPSFLPGLSAGLSWRSEVHLGFSGFGDFDAEAPFRALLPPDGAVSTQLILPQSLLLGVAYTLGPIEAEIDVNYVNWSRQPETRIRLADGSEQLHKRSYRDTVILRVGGEFNLWELGIAMRLGYAFDPTPVPARTVDLTLPDVDRHIFTAGGTYFLPHQMFVHAGLLWIVPFSRQTKDKPLTPVLKGNYHASALAATISFGVTFGADPRPQPQMVRIPWLTDPEGPLGQ